MSDYPQDRDRLLELLADQATVGLSDPEHDELQRLLVQFPDVERDGFELAAAAAHLAYAGSSHESMPAELASRLRAKALEDPQSQPSGSTNAAGTPASVSDSRTKGSASLGPTLPAPALGMTREHEPRHAAAWIGWLVAAAAIVVAVLGWWPELVSRNGPSRKTPAERHAQLLKLDPKAVDLPWTVNDPLARDVSGNIVFSTTRQEGSMRLRGLQPLDAAKHTYQLWIFDGPRGSPPVDGGIFNVDPAAVDAVTGDVFLSFHPRLSVQMPVLFAVTREPAGGVVVSKQDPLLLIAPVKKS